MQLMRAAKAAPEANKEAARATAQSFRNKHVATAFGGKALTQANQFLSNKHTIDFAANMGVGAAMGGTANTIYQLGVNDDVNIFGTFAKGAAIGAGIAGAGTGLVKGFGQLGRLAPKTPQKVVGKAAPAALPAAGGSVSSNAAHGALQGPLPNLDDMLTRGAALKKAFKQTTSQLKTNTRHESGPIMYAGPTSPASTSMAEAKYEMRRRAKAVDPSSGPVINVNGPSVKAVPFQGPSLDVNQPLVTRHGKPKRRFTQQKANGGIIM